MILHWLQHILDWSEAWAPLIPLISLTFLGKQTRHLAPLILYLWFAFFVNTAIDIGWKFSTCIHDSGNFSPINQSRCVPGWMYPNNYLYNIHSIGRFLCFTAFFYLLTPAFRTTVDKLIPVVALACLVINFSFFESFINPEMFSSRLFAAEAGLLLFYCIRYFLLRMNTKAPTQKVGKEYWVIVGLSIYVVFNFFYFLLYTTLLSNKNNEQFVADMWNLHNVTFIILCTFITRAFYAAGHN